MEIELPFELGDKVIVIRKKMSSNFTEYWALETAEFSYDLIGEYMEDKVFADLPMAEKKLAEFKTGRFTKKLS